MNRRHKALLTESILVLVATLISVIGLIHLKDYINRSEAMRAMGQLGEALGAYRQRHGSLPPESFIEAIRDQLDGGVRMGNVRYLALYIGPDVPPDTVLAYSHKRYPSSLLEEGYVVLRLGGTVEWLSTAEFDELLASQRLPAEPNRRTGSG